jgi:hypothetical protein
MMSVMATFQQLILGGICKWHKQQDNPLVTIISHAVPYHRRPAVGKNVFFLGGDPMTPEEREQMNLLAFRIQEEKNYDTFTTLLRELNQLAGRKARRLNQDVPIPDFQRSRPWRTLRAVVQKIVKPVHPDLPERVEISIPGAEDLFREIRIENTLTDPDGQAVALKNGAQVDVTFETDATNTVKKLADARPSPLQ